MRMQALTLIDLALRPDVVASAKHYVPNVQTKDRKYTPLIYPQHTPVVHLNRAIEEKYRPELRNYYYDPARYEAYLVQLGIITYPTVRKAEPKPTAGQD